MLQVGEHAFTVLDLMRHMAYVGGVVHALDPDDERDQALHEFRGLTQVSGVGPGLRTLRAIGRVVLIALVPLREALLESLRKPLVPGAESAGGDVDDPDDQPDEPEQ